MTKPKLKDFKKYLTSLDESAVRTELEKLFKKLPQVQEFYAQELMSEADRKAMLDGYKEKIYYQYWTRGGNPRIPNNKEVNRLISNFERISIFPHELVDLLLYRVDTTTDLANTLGGMPDAAYNSSIRSFEKAVELIVANKLEEMFRTPCEEIFEYRNLDNWYIDEMRYTYEQAFG